MYSRTRLFGTHVNWDKNSSARCVPNKRSRLYWKTGEKISIVEKKLWWEKWSKKTLKLENLQKIGASVKQNLARKLRVKNFKLENV